MAKPENYGTNNPDEMANIDQNQEDFEAMLYMGLDQKDFTFTVKSEED